MAMLPEVFNSDDHEDSGFNVMPAGWYEAEIVKSEVKENSKKTGSYLSLQFKIINNEEFKGRNVWTNLNLVNPNQTTVEIAQKDLATICRAVDVATIEDSEELHNIPLAIKLSVRPETPQWPERNEVKGYKSVDELDDSSDSTPF